MEWLALLGVGAVIIVALAGFLISIFGKSKYDQGTKDAELKHAIESDIARKRADAVLAEHRDPDDVDKRLREGNF